MFALKEKWSTVYRPKQFTCDVHSLARSEGVNKMVESRLYARASILELIKLVEDIDKRVDIRCE